MRKTIQTIQHDNPVNLSREINQRAEMAAMEGCELRVIGFTHVHSSPASGLPVYTAMVELSDPKKTQLNYDGDSNELPPISKSGIG